MADPTFNWAFVGAGWMAKAQAADLKHVPGARVYGVVARTRTSARAFARQFKARAYDSLEALLSDPAVDIVHITSPNNLHYPQAKAALLAGKAVLCEKPFTLNAAQLEDMVATARAYNSFLMEAMWVRFLPAQVRLRQLLAQGAIGELQSVRFGFHTNARYDAASRLYNPALGGGALLDVGIYPLSLAASLLGAAPEAVASYAHLGPTGVDHHFSAVLAYPGGQRALLSGGFDGFPSQPLELQGSHGRVHIPAENGVLKHERLVLHTETDGELVIEAPLAGAGYVHQAIEVQRCLAVGELESPILPLDESLAVMRLLDRLRAEWGLRYPGE